MELCGGVYRVVMRSREKWLQNSINILRVNLRVAPALRALEFSVCVARGHWIKPSHCLTRGQTLIQSLQPERTGEVRPTPCLDLVFTRRIARLTPFRSLTSASMDYQGVTAAPSPGPRSSTAASAPLAQSNH